MTFEEKLDKYATMCITVGAKLKKGQPVHISSDINSCEFARMVAKKAYEYGAKDVVVTYSDEVLTKIRFLNAPIESFGEVNDYLLNTRLELLEKNYVFISIVSDDPEILKDCDPEKVAISGKARSTKMLPFTKRLMNNESQWLVVAGVSEASAKKVFPNDNIADAKEKLWDLYFKACRIDENDVTKNWEAHVSNIKKSVEYLNKQCFEKVVITSSNGTNIEVGLADDHLWQGGGDTTLDGHYFMPNLPTEEVFCMPHKDRVNGIVKSSKPLNFRGNLIDNFSLAFKDGVVVDFDATDGYDTLKGLLDSDDGAKHLGEIALVPFDSPISNSNVIYYNTLYDENASCHFALGRAYPTNIIGGENMNEDELKSHGANNSIIHEDFMFGTNDTKIVGIKKDGTEVLIFENGNFVNVIFN